MTDAHGLIPASRKENLNDQKMALRLAGTGAQPDKWTSSRFSFSLGAASQKNVLKARKRLCAAIEEIQIN